MPYTRLLKADEKVIAFLSIIVPIQIIAMGGVFISSFWKKDLKDKEWFKNLIPLLAYSIGTFFVVFPIAEKGHFSIAATCTVISIIYFGYAILDKCILKNKKIRYAIRIFTGILGKLLLLLLVTFSISKMIYYFQNEDRNTEYKHFNNLIIGKSLNKQMTLIDDFIKQKEQEGKTVYILDSTAVVYMIPLDRYNKDYDLFALGNFGGKGNKGVIEDIKTKENAMFLILQDVYPIHWQCPTEVIDYVKENYEKVESIAVFDAYEKTE